MGKVVVNSAIHAIKLRKFTNTLLDLLQYSMQAFIKSIQTNKFLIVELLKQNLFTQYKQSKFSLFWIIFNPFFQIIIWSILHYSGFLSVGSVQVPYLIYLVAGMILWWFAFNIYESVSTIYSKYSGIILENRFDLSVLIIEAILRQMIFFIIHLIVLFIICIYFKFHFQSAAILYPLLLLPLLFFSVALGLVFAVWRILAVDLAMIFDKMMALLFFITPILYKPTYDNPYKPNLDNPLLSYIIRFNPFTHLIILPRNALIYGELPPIIGILVIYIISFVLMYLSLRYFQRMKFKTIEKLLQ